MKNFILSLLMVCIGLSAVLGVCFLVKDYEKRANEITSVNREYAEALDKLKEEVNINIENVTELTKEIELKGLTIDDLTRTVTEYKTEVVVLKETVTEYETIIVEKDNTIQNQQNEIQTVTQTVVEYRDRIVYLEKDNSDKESEIENLEGSSAEDKARIAELEAEIQANNREISSLNQEIRDLEAEIQEKNATIASLQDEIAQLEATKNEVEVQIVEKETIIVEKEEIIVEKEAEIQELNVNINVLNQTIVELNVQIELLENSSIENINTDLYTALLHSRDIEVVILEDENYLLFSENAKCLGIFYVDSATFEITQIYDKYFGWRYSYVLPNGNVTLSSTAPESGMLEFNLETKELVEVVNSGYAFDYATTINNGDLIFTSTETSSGAIYYDVEEETFTSLVTYGEDWVYFAELQDGNYIMNSYGLTTGMHYLDVEAKTLTSLGGSGMQTIYYINMSDGNTLFTSAGHSSSRLYLYNAEDKTFTLLKTSNVISKFYETDDKKVLMPNPGGGILAYDMETKTLSVVYETGTWSVFCELDNGNYLMLPSSNSGSIALYSIEDDSVSLIYEISATWNIVHKLDNGNVLIGSSSNTYGLLLYDVETNTISQLTTTGRYLNTFIDVGNGDVIIGSSNSFVEVIYIYKLETETLEILNNKKYISIGSYATLSNGDILFYDQCFIYDISEETFNIVYEASGYENFYETKDGKILMIYTNVDCSNPSVMVVDIETKEYQSFRFEYGGYIDIKELDNGLLLYNEEHPEIGNLFYSYETKLVKEVNDPSDLVTYPITLINATTADECSFSIDSISSGFIGEEVEFVINVPSGHYPQGFQVLTLDSEGNEQWTSISANGGMNGMTIFKCKFVLKESYIINNTLTLRYRSYMQM